jgi:diguanylate cyclase (GGDEF)-like protein
MTDDADNEQPRKRKPLGKTLPMGYTSPFERWPLREELQNLQLLRRVSLESVHGLLMSCAIQELEPGQKLLEAGRPNRTMYLILTGRLAVHIDGPDSQPLTQIEAGESVGELSVIDEQPASADVIAQTRVRTLAVDETAFWRLVAASHEFSTNMLMLLAQRMRESNAAIAENQRLRKRFEREALVDGLTGVHNRRWLDDILPRLISRHQRGGQPLSLLMLDVDHFKRFNDTHGHAAGDQALAKVAKLIATRMRPTDMCARYGGEEFVIILPYTPLTGGLVAAERTRAIIADTPIDPSEDGLLPPVTVSLGAAGLEPRDDAKALITRADQALYRAKAGGRNRVES